MNTQQYRKLREEIGTQEIVSVLLGIDESTLSRRERGEVAISSEAASALEVLAIKMKAKCSPLKKVNEIRQLAKLEKSCARRGMMEQWADEIEFLFSEIKERQDLLTDAVCRYASASGEKEKRFAWEMILIRATVDGGEVSESARSLHL